MGHEAGLLAERLHAFDRVEADGIVERTAMLPGEKAPCFSVTVAPSAGPSRRTGVVICHSYFELKMFQGAELGLLRRAAAHGFAGIYVQAPGMGDSLGDVADCMVADRVAAVRVAADHLRDTHTEVEQVCFVGARFGAAIAMLAASEQGGAAGLALWDPAFDGDEYWRQLRRFERVVGALRRRRTEDPDVELAREGVTGTVGYPVTQQQRDDLREIDQLRSRPLDAPTLAVCLNEAAAMAARRTLQPLVPSLETATLSRPKAQHLMHMRIDDAQGASAPTVQWMERTLP